MDNFLDYLDERVRLCKSMKYGAAEYDFDYIMDTAEIIIGELNREITRIGEVIDAKRLNQSIGNAMIPELEAHSVIENE